MTGLLWDTATAATAWLDRHNGRDPHEITLRILKVMEEAGEVASARIADLGQNPRKPARPDSAEVTAAELADVIITAAVAIESLGLPPRHVLDTACRKVLHRIESSVADSADGRV